MRRGFCTLGHTTVRVPAFSSRSVAKTVFPSANIWTSRSSGEPSYEMPTETLPLLLPASVLGTKSGSDPHEWEPSKYRYAPQPPPTDDSKQHDQEMAAARQLIDGKAFKKVRPRRTIDYFAGVGRWTLVRFHGPC